MIDKHSPTPIYFQLEHSLRRQIEDGELLPGELLPSEREFAEKLGISRMTVRQAITNLVNEGFLYRQKGRGTFVSEKKLEQRLSGLTSFTEDMRMRGLTPASKLLSFKIIPADVKTAERLQIQDYASVYEIIRVRLADEVPMALETVYMSVNLVKDLTEKLVSASLYTYIENELSLSIGRAAQSMEAVLATENEEEHLLVPKGAPVLFIERNTYLTNGTPLEHVKSFYRADRYKLTVDINR
ncbi:phosphonate metabolism transcriptional regulator PhnF [Domibacillus antri]|uniref:Phosphonate metabolism transcriptional regulator PhnF n=1 Tax=Domibacillus antri TaxID=1714264 RepID=A0A1Q8Q3J8_9BACI|nr:GntR family transcriptional regulator [Domibacillus antri]OLN21919.1 phosphonate metabolism transcriptional regulator PhnF [Domibacillus antri]